MLATEQKQEIINTFKKHEGDTGSPEVQIALLTERELEVLRLVVTNGDVLRIVQQNITRHEDWVVKQADAHTFVAKPCRFVFELRHTTHFAKTSEAIEYDGKLAVCWHVALAVQMNGIVIEGQAGGYIYPGVIHN